MWTATDNCERLNHSTAKSLVLRQPYSEFENMKINTGHDDHW